jgi:hypothetical protein
MIAFLSHMRPTTLNMMFSPRAIVKFGLGPSPSERPAVTNSARQLLRTLGRKLRDT